MVDYFLNYLDNWGYSVFGILWGDYYAQDIQNVVDAIILQMGDVQLFNDYYNSFAIGCSCSVADGFVCSYVLSSQVTRADDVDTAAWNVLLPQDQCGTLCSANTS